MKGRSSTKLMLTSVFAALYSLGVIFLAPISFQLFQVRIADALLPLSMIFGWPVVIGVSVGAFVANIFGGLGPVDMFGGALANFIATLAAWRIVKSAGIRWMPLGSAVIILVITAIVGTYLSFLLEVPITVMWLGILLGSLAAIGILGSFIFFAFTRKNVTSILAAHGLSEDAEAR